jgi:hypothetical protein
LFFEAGERLSEDVLFVDRGGPPEIEVDGSRDEVAVEYWSARSMESCVVEIVDRSTLLLV